MFFGIFQANLFFSRISKVRVVDFPLNLVTEALTTLTRFGMKRILIDAFLPIIAFRQRIKKNAFS